MITMSELLKGAKFESQSPEVQSNLTTLLDLVNRVRKAYGKPMVPTSGLRTMDDHLRIYCEKAQREGRPFDQSKVPMKSRHLFGQAVDIADPKRELQAWCLKNEIFLLQCGLWLESFEDTPNWVHFQSVQYGSWKPGKSVWFKP
jgi:uncharacterized protein YcbK (DUF882 family)